MPEAHPVLWAVLAGLLCLSAAFSASETALFSLDPGERVRAGPRARRLLERPRDLLVTVLLGNLVVNTLFFATAGRLEPGGRAASEVILGLAALLVLLVVGEVLPKVVGLRAPVPIARAVSPPLSGLVLALGPVRRAVIWLLEGICRLLGPLARDERALMPEDFSAIFDGIAAEGSLVRDEADLLASIVELSEVRVREIMTPRVDTVFLQLDGSNREAAVTEALRRRLSFLPVVDGDPDRIAGRVRLRDLLLSPDKAAAELVMPVKFVPEVARCLDLMHDFHEDRASEAIVVDEWGGTAGHVTMESLFEEIVGDLRVEEEERVPAAVPLGEGRYRVPGGLSIREWNDRFGRRVVPLEFETVGGFVTALLGRIPRVGDEVRYGDLVLVVHEVRGRRVRSVDVAAAGAQEAAP